MHDISPAPDQCALICLPYAGGSSIAYRHWRYLDLGLKIKNELVALDYPGHLMRPEEPLSYSMSELADALMGEVTRRWERPFILCGASLGGLVAFELAKRAESAGHPPLALITAACAAPYARTISYSVSNLSDEEFIQLVTERYGGAIGRILQDRKTQEILLPILRADMLIVENYTSSQDRTMLSSDVIAIAGEDDRAVSLNEAARWRDHTTGQTHLVSVPGNHFIVETHAEEVAAQLRAIFRHIDGVTTHRPAGQRPTQ
jgi:surfactin synthase thioesterase subunit